MCDILDQLQDYVAHDCIPCLTLVTYPHPTTPYTHEHTLHIHTMNTLTQTMKSDSKKARVSHQVHSPNNIHHTQWSMQTLITNPIDQHIYMHIGLHTSTHTQ